MTESNEYSKDAPVNIFRDLPTLTEYLKNSAQPIDISKCVDSSIRVLCLGETHTRTGKTVFDRSPPAIQTIRF
jgi:hypothetical protein